MFQKLTTYIKETRLEMKKVNWPTRRSAMRMTLAVIAVSATVAGVLGAFDFLFGRIFLLII